MQNWIPMCHQKAQLYPQQSVQQEKTRENINPIQLNATDFSFFLSWQNMVIIGNLKLTSKYDQVINPLYSFRH